MTRILIVVLLHAMFCFSAEAQQFMQNRRKAFQPVVVSGPTYLIEENFEGAGAPTGWDDGAGTPNYDYATSPAPLEGSQSLLLHTATMFVTNGFAAKNDAWCYAKIYTTNSAALSLYFGFYSDGNLAAAVRMNAPFTGRIYAGTANTSIASPNGLNTNTVYHVWIHGIAGTGADSQAHLYFSTDGVKPESPNVSKVNGNNTTGFNVIRLWSDGATCSMIADRVIVDDAEIGNSP
jgi:hypothetical protein